MAVAVSHFLVVRIAIYKAWGPLVKRQSVQIGVKDNG